MSEEKCHKCGENPAEYSNNLCERCALSLGYFKIVPTVTICKEEYDKLKAEIERLKAQIDIFETWLHNEKWAAKEVTIYEKIIMKVQKVFDESFSKKDLEDEE